MLDKSVSNEIERIESIGGYEALCEKYGYAHVITVLATVWNLDKTLSVFEEYLKNSSDRPVATIATSYWRAYNGGIEHAHSLMMDIWVRMGYRVILLTDEDENEADYPYPDNVKRYIIPSPDYLSERLLTINDCLVSEKVDLFINHNSLWWNTHSIIWEMILARHLGIHYVVYCHGYFSNSFMCSTDALLIPRVYALCDAILSLSESSARFYQLCGCRSYLIRNPIPDYLFNVKRKNIYDSKHILWVGRLADEKRPLDALKIFKIIHDVIPDTVLDMVGGCDYVEIYQELVEYCRSNDLEENVVFHGLKSQSDLQKFYENSSIMLFTSQMESFSMVLLECKAHGLPCVMYDLPYLTLVQDRRGIIAAPMGDVELLAGKAIRLLTDFDEMKRIGNEAGKSFDDFAVFDYENAWKEIIRIASHKDIESESDRFYSPDKISDADRYIIPMLFEAWSHGVEYTLSHDRDKIFGQKLLKLPRAIKQKLRGRIIDR